MRGVFFLCATFLSNWKELFFLIFVIFKCTEKNGLNKQSLLGRKCYNNLIGMFIMICFGISMNSKSLMEKKHCLMRNGHLEFSFTVLVWLISCFAFFLVLFILLSQFFSAITSNTYKINMNRLISTCLEINPMFYCFSLCNLLVELVFY